MAKKIIFGAIAIILLSGGGFLAGWFISAGTSSSRIAELEDTVDKLRKSDKLTQERYQNLERDRDKLREDNERFKRTIDSLGKGIADADDALRKAYESSRRLEEIHKHIGN